MRGPGRGLVRRGTALEWVLDAPLQCLPWPSLTVPEYLALLDHFQLARIWPSTCGSSRDGAAVRLCRRRAKDARVGNGGSRRAHWCQVGILRVGLLDLRGCGQPALGFVQQRPQRPVPGEPLHQVRFIEPTAPAAVQRALQGRGQKSGRTRGSGRQRTGSSIAAGAAVGRVAGEPVCSTSLSTRPAD